MQLILVSFFCIPIGDLCSEYWYCLSRPIRARRPQPFAGRFRLQFKSTMRRRLSVKTAVLGAVKVRDHMATELVTLSPETVLLCAVHTLLTNDIAAEPVDWRVLAISIIL